MNRQENLIQILLKAEKPLTTQELAEQLYWSSFFVTHCSINN